MEEFLALPIPVLDPRDEEELVEAALEKVVSVSGGVINDVSPAGTVRPIIEGVVLPCAELKFYMNQLPLAFALTWFSAAGVSQKLGSKATGLIRFNLDREITEPYTVPKGFQINGVNNKNYLVLNTTTVPAYTTYFYVEVEAEFKGSEYNAAPFALGSTNQSLNFLASVTNEEAIIGGTDDEFLGDTIERGVRALRLRSITTRKDYEESAEYILGAGSIAKAVPNLQGDKVTVEKGYIHLFLLNAVGEPASNIECNQVSAYIETKQPEGVGLNVSPVEILPVFVEAVLRIKQGVNSQIIADLIWDNLQNIDKRSAVGKKLFKSEVEYIIRSVGGIEYLEYSLLNDKAFNVEVGTPFTLPSIKGATLTLINEDNVEFLFSYGEIADYNG